MHRDVRRLLADEAASLPVTTADVRHVLREARRARLRRRLVLTGIALSLGAVLYAVTLGPLSLRPAAHTASVDVAASGTATVAAAPNRFDPMVRTLRVGWTPAGLTESRMEIDRYEQEFVAGDSDDEDALAVSVLTTGQASQESTPSASRRTADVNGRPASCLATDCSALRFEYVAGAYGTVEYHGADAASAARRVAESVSLSEAVPVSLPFTLTGRTAKLTVRQTVTAPDSATVVLSDNTTITASHGDHVETVGHEPGTGVYDTHGLTVTIVAPRPRDVYDDLRF